MLARPLTSLSSRVAPHMCDNSARLRCKVHKDAIVVVVTARERALKQDAPLLNRHEKHALGYKDTLTEEQWGLVRMLKTWMRAIAQSGATEEAWALLPTAEGRLGRNDEWAAIENSAFPGFKGGTHDTLLCSLVQMVCERTRGERYSQDRRFELCKQEQV